MREIRRYHNGIVAEIVDDVLQRVLVGLACNPTLAPEILAGFILDRSLHRTKRLTSSSKRNITRRSRSHWIRGNRRAVLEIVRTDRRP